MGKSQTGGAQGEWEYHEKYEGTELLPQREGAIGSRGVEAFKTVGSSVEKDWRHAEDGGGDLGEIGRSSMISGHCSRTSSTIAKTICVQEKYDPLGGRTGPKDLPVPEPSENALQTVAEG